MRKLKAAYHCGYCNRKFVCEFPIHEYDEIPKHSIGCTYCRTAGHKVTLIKKESLSQEDHLFLRYIYGSKKSILENFIWKILNFIRR